MTGEAVDSTIPLDTGTMGHNTNSLVADSHTTVNTPRGVYATEPQHNHFS